jgi:hypothetical protein
MDSTGFFDMKPCRVLEIYRLFGVTSCLPPSSLFYIEDGSRQHVPPKRRYIYIDRDLNVAENNIQIKKHEMGEECCTYAGEDRYIKDFGGEGWGKRTSWKTQA